MVMDTTLEFWGESLEERSSKPVQLSKEIRGVPRNFYSPLIFCMFSLMFAGCSSPVTRQCSCQDL